MRFVYVWDKLKFVKQENKYKKKKKKTNKEERCSLIQLEWRKRERKSEIVKLNVWKIGERRLENYGKTIQHTRTSITII